MPRETSTSQLASSPKSPLHPECFSVTSPFGFLPEFLRSGMGIELAHVIHDFGELLETQFAGRSVKHSSEGGCDAISFSLPNITFR